MSNTDNQVKDLNRKAEESMKNSGYKGPKPAKVRPVESCADELFKALDDLYIAVKQCKIDHLLPDELKQANDILNQVSDPEATEQILKESGHL